LGAWQPVEGVVHLDRVEVPRVVLEPEPRRETAVELILPRGVVPAGAAYADRPLTTSRHNSSVPAAAMRERGTRSSGAESNGSSRSACASDRPRSRTSSWPAATSTERNGFSEQTASTRPAARWQSESAREPMIRRRYATPVNAAA